MNARERIGRAIGEATGRLSRIVAEHHAAGGSINNAGILELEDGRRYFVKSARGAVPPDTFRIEYESLELLAAPDAVDVPRPLCWGEDFLVLECIEEGPKARDWEERMGRSLARLQQQARRQSFGFHCDNYLGTTPQPNGWLDSWPDFWRQRRLGHQLRLFADRGGVGDPLLEAGERLMSRLDDLLGGIREDAVLLHGDLWAGNASANAAGDPVIFDPACYYGHREAEFGMMRMFGGFGPRCEAAYAEIWPFEEGFEERCALYRLYHELNHLNLFGRAYYAACMNTIERLI